MLKQFSIISIAMLTLAGCANNDVYSSDVYSSSQAKQAQSVSYGTITSLRPVTIKSDSDNVIGTVGGAVIGGFLGNAVGGGTGRSLATAAGAVAGGVAGREIESRASESNGVEIEIKKDNGATISVVQKASGPRFNVGQRVRLSELGGTINVSPL